MFTGIIEDVGVVKTIFNIQNGIKLNVQSKLSKELNLGDSIAVNGACLTVTGKTENTFSVDVSYETINKTNIGKLKVNDRVNLERALKLSDRLDGHIVLGHVDTTATIKSLNRVGEFYLLSLNINQYIFDHCVEKGSISVNGTSLTIAKLEKTYLDVAVIPFTFENTNLKYAKPGDIVNIEVDIIGKYVKKFLKTPNKGIDEDFLRQHGFI